MVQKQWFKFLNINPYSKSYSKLSICLAMLRHEASLLLLIFNRSRRDSSYLRINKREPLCLFVTFVPSWFKFLNINPYSKSYSKLSICLAMLRHEASLLLLIFNRSRRDSSYLRINKREPLCLFVTFVPSWFKTEVQSSATNARIFLFFLLTFVHLRFLRALVVQNL